MMNDWMTPADMVAVAATELSEAMQRHGVAAHAVNAEGDEVDVLFYGIQDAQAFLTLTIEAATEPAPGSLYDRVTSGCGTFTLADALGQHMSIDQRRHVLSQSWKWTVHPDMVGRRVDWHVAVSIPVEDALYVTTRLNEIHRGSL